MARPYNRDESDYDHDHPDLGLGELQGEVKAVLVCHFGEIQSLFQVGILSVLRIGPFFGHANTIHW